MSSWFRHLTDNVTAGATDWQDSLSGPSPSKAGALAHRSSRDNITAAPSGFTNVDKSQDLGSVPGSATSDPDPILRDTLTANWKPSDLEGRPKGNHPIGSEQRDINDELAEHTHERLPPARHEDERLLVSAEQKDMLARANIPDQVPDAATYGERLKHTAHVPHIGLGE